jgi:7,8-dihydro-6-hydroxymethylpterin-pyrophosphokinase
VEKLVAAWVARMRDEYLLLLGSNHRRAAGLRFALRRLSGDFDIVACTGAQRTRDGDGSRYLNAAVLIGVAGDCGSDALRQRLRAIEAEAGRVRGGDVCALDIDLVAKCRGRALVDIYKPNDLRRSYAIPLLYALGIDTYGGA